MSYNRVQPIKSEGKRKRELTAVVSKINGFFGRYREELGNLNPNNVTDRTKAEKYFKTQTRSLRSEIQTYISLGYSEEDALKRVLPKAYATVKLASDFLWKKPHYDVQLIGGMLINDGYASEMATGEGKTLTAALPAYLNALLGKGVHVVTPNGYLAKRDAEEMGELYELVGLSCGLVEERGKITPELLMSKTVELLGDKLKKYTADAKTEEEREALINQFLSAKENAFIVGEAKSKALAAIREEDKLKRKKAYGADITYGSASAIAFDYLYDDIAKDPNEMVQRSGNPNFAIVDEVDAVLFDDATTPFSLSGTQTDEELAITADERKEAQRSIDLANYAVRRIKTENENLIKRNKAIGEAGRLIVTTNDSVKFETITAGDTEQSKEYDLTRALIINTKTDEYKLTTLGETIIFQYYYAKDIRRILLENKDAIIGMQQDGKQTYRDGYDYEIVNGLIQMEPRAFAHLILSGKIPELTETFERFGLNELTKEKPAIDNALTAWFILKENEDYTLSVPSDAKSPNERTVSLVMNGRTAEGRVYSNGLQQAIEAKEKTLKPKIKIKKTEIKNTLASIPTASFFARYDKFAGMTGTAAISAFRELYGLETHEVPRRKPRQAIDMGDRLYATTEEKNEAIFQEVLKSYKKGQPVLLSTTSIDESIELYRYLDRRFKEEKIDVQIPVLNANVDKLEDEARIVSMAGKPGAITISTEMAGRGTDIKLGGEVPEVSTLIQQIGEERIASTMAIMEKQGIVTDATREKFEREIRKKVFSDKETLEKAANLRRSQIAVKRDQMERQVLEAGGLKVIGSGHFSYSRVDDQVKGRCGRQGNPGEIIFFNDPDDLLRVGIPHDTVEKLQQQASLEPIVEDPKTGKFPLGDLIYDAQAKTESLVQASIRQSQEVEVEVAKYRTGLRAQREELKRSGDYIDAVEYMLEETVKDILVASSKKNNPTLRDKTRISKAKLDYKELASLTSEFLGVEIDQMDLRRFRTLGEVREYITDLGLERYRDRAQELGTDAMQAESKKVVDKLLSRTWNDFEGFVETIKRQDMLNRTFQTAKDGQLHFQIGRAFAHCVESERAMIVRELVNPDYQTTLTTKPRTELAPVRVTPNGVERVARDYDEKVEESIAEMEAETRVTSNIKNLQPRPRIFTLVNKAKLNTNSATLGGVGVSQVDEEIESVDFGDSPKGKR